MTKFEELKKALLATKRDGIEELIKHMESIGFSTAPCSGGNHLCIEGGLAEHTVNVLEQAHKIGKTLLGDDYDDMKNSITIAAVLHDLGKCGDYSKAMYVDNILKSGKVSDAKPYKRNPELSAVPHAVRSIKLSTFFIDLTEDEEWAILTHDGLYDFMKYDMQGKETALSMIIHWADMWASKIIEKAESEE